MEEREFNYKVEIILTPKLGNIRFSEIVIQGTGLDDITADKLLDVTSNLKDDVDATINMTMTTK